MLKKFFVKPWRISISIIFIIFILCTILLCLHIKNNNFKIPNEYEITTDPNYVRIYYDFATISSLYQTYDFLQQDSNSVIFLRWDRTPNLKEKLSKWKNTYILEHGPVPLIFSELDPKPVLKYYKKHPDSKFIIHTNANWISNLEPILYNLPKNAIKEIHVYEDGSYSSSIVKEPNKDDTMNYKKLDTIVHSYFTNTPIIFHMEDAEYLNSNKCLFDKQCLFIKNLHKKDIVVKSSIMDLKDKLDANPKIKETYFKIFDFDYKKYEREIKHPFGVYTFGLSKRNKQIQEIHFWGEIMHGNLNYLVKDKNVNWFFKRHPFANSRIGTSELVRYKYPNVTEIPKSIPMEMFLLSDIIPDYVAGYSSGVYLSFPKRSICAYIMRPKDPYLYIINRDHRIRTGRLFNIENYNNSFKSKIRRLISRFFVFFQNMSS